MDLTFEVKAKDFKMYSRGRPRGHECSLSSTCLKNIDFSKISNFSHAFFLPYIETVQYTVSISVDTMFECTANSVEAL